MPNIRGKQRFVGIWLPEATYCEIERVINLPRSQVDSVGKYVKLNIERYVWRHSKNPPKIEPYPY